MRDVVIEATIPFQSQQATVLVARYRAFVENSPDAFWEADAQSVITFANDAACRLLGYSRQELIGMVGGDLLVDPHAESRRLTREELHAQGSLTNRKARVRMKSGEIRTVNYSARVLRDERGNLLGYQLVSRDVSEQEQVLETLARRTQELSVLNEIGKILSQPLEIQSALGQVCEKITSLVGMESAAVFRIDQINQEMRVIADYGISAQLRANMDHVTLSDFAAHMVAVEGKPIALNDALRERPELGLAGPRAEKYRALIGVPIMRHGAPVGVLGVGSRLTNEYHQTDVELLESIGHTIGSALENSDLFAQMQARVEELDGLARLSVELSASLDPAEIADHTAAAAKRLLRADACGVRLREGALTRVAAARTHRDDAPVAVERPVTSTFLSIVESRQPRWVNDLDTDTTLPPEDRERMQVHGMRAALSVPLLARQGALGVVTVAKANAHPWAEREIDLLQTLANHAANALANAHLFQQISIERNKVQAILDSGFSGLYAVDRAGRFTIFNRAAEQISGWSRAAVERKTWKDIFGADSKEQPVIYQALADHVPHRILEGRRLRTRSGNLIPIAEAAAPLLDEQAQVIGAVGAFWDLSREQAAEQTREFLLQTVMHELGAALTKILPTIELIDDPHQPAETRSEMWGYLKTAARGLKEMSDHFLQREKNLAAHPQIRSDTLDLFPLISQVVNEFGGEASGGRIHVQTSRGQWRVKGDRHRFETILRNLIENALKYSPAYGLVTVSAHARKGRIEIVVEDEGPGIPAQERRKILKPFARGSAGFQSSAKGYGLGLAIARQFAEDMDGVLRIGGRAGKGARISFTLRRAK